MVATIPPGSASGKPHQTTGALQNAEESSCQPAASQQQSRAPGTAPFKCAMLQPHLSSLGSHPQIRAAWWKSPGKTMLLPSSEGAGHVRGGARPMILEAPCGAPGWTCSTKDFSPMQHP